MIRGIASVFLGFSMSFFVGNWQTSCLLHGQNKVPADALECWKLGQGLNAGKHSEISFRYKTIEVRDGVSGVPYSSNRLYQKRGGNWRIVIDHEENADAPKESIAFVSGSQHKFKVFRRGDLLKKSDSIWALHSLFEASESPDEIELVKQDLDSLFGVSFGFQGNSFNEFFDDQKVEIRKIENSTNANGVQICKIDFRAEKSKMISEFLDRVDGYCVFFPDQNWKLSHFEYAANYENDGGNGVLMFSRDIHYDGNDLAKINDETTTTFNSTKVTTKDHYVFEDFSTDKVESGVFKIQHYGINPTSSKKWWQYSTTWFLVAGFLLVSFAVFLKTRRGSQDK